MFDQIQVFGEEQQYDNKQTKFYAQRQDNQHSQRQSSLQQQSVQLQPYKDQFCSKLSNATRCTIESESEDNYSITDLLKNSFSQHDENTIYCTDYCNKMVCFQGSECMFSHDLSYAQQQINSKSTLSLFKLLQEYPQLAILKGSRRGYSLFFS